MPGLGIVFNVPGDSACSVWSSASIVTFCDCHAGSNLGHMQRSPDSSRRVTEPSVAISLVQLPDNDVHKAVPEKPQGRHTVKDQER